MQLVRFPIALFGVVASTLLVTPVYGFSNGAGGCVGREAAVYDFHLDSSNGRPVSNNTLEAGGVLVSIGDILLQTDEVQNLSISQDHIVTIASFPFPMRGMLLRIEAPSDSIDTTGAILPGSLLQSAMVCEAPVVGVTHIDNSDKTIVTSTIRFDEVVQSVSLDITVVFINSIEGSVYTYSRYTVNFVEDDYIVNVTETPIASPKTDAPSPAPKDTDVPATNPPSTPPVSLAPTTGAPFSTFAPTESPVEPETEAPVATNAPTSSPTSMAPVLITSDWPSSAPTQMPLPVETLRPSPSSGVLSSDMPSDSPALANGKGKGTNPMQGKGNDMKTMNGKGKGGNVDGNEKVTGKMGKGGGNNRDEPIQGKELKGQYYDKGDASTSESPDDNHDKKQYKKFRDSSTQRPMQRFRKPRRPSGQ